jgi:hypothetical protein
MPYNKYSGMNNVINTSNAFCTEVITDPAAVPASGHYHGWYYLDATPMMPTRFKMVPRPGLTADWYLKNQPKSLVITGLKYDMTEVEVFRNDNLPDWSDGATREWNIQTDKNFVGYKAYVPNTNSFNNGDSYHWCMSHSVMHGAFPIDDMYIEKHAYWRMAHNEQGGDAHLDVNPEGTVVNFKQNTVNPKAQNIKFQDRVAPDGHLTFKYTAEPTGSDNWTLIGKMVNDKNLVGCRYNAGQMQVVQRRNGSWTNKKLVDYTFTLGMKIDFIIKWDGKIFVYVDDVLVIETTTQITEEGYWGISSHKIPKDYPQLLSEFNVKGTTREYPSLICGSSIFCEDAFLVSECYEYTYYEMLRDYQFDCGLEHFGFDPAYPATLTTPVDGEIHIKSNSNYGSIVPKWVPNTNDGREYIVRVKVKNISGDGKLSLRVNNSWKNPVVFNGVDGIYEQTFTGTLNTINTGANYDPSFEADFEFLSLRLSNDPAPQELLVDSNGDALTDDNGNALTTDIT